MEALDGEVENLYGLLTDDDVSGGVRIEAENRLKRNGIDVDDLRRNFVTHQAVHTYLTKYRGASKRRTKRGDEERLEKARETIRRLQSRLAAVTETTLNQLTNGSNFTLGTTSVFVDIRVLCEECGTQFSLPDLLANGGCDCQTDAEQ
jgi:hypothetical protein